MYQFVVHYSKDMQKKNIKMHHALICDHKLIYRDSPLSMVNWDQENTTWSESPLSRAFVPIINNVNVVGLNITFYKQTLTVTLKKKYTSIQGEMNWNCFSVGNFVVTVGIPEVPQNFGPLYVRKQILETQISSSLRTPFKNVLFTTFWTHPKNQGKGKGHRVTCHEGTQGR